MGDFVRDFVQVEELNGRKTGRHDILMLKDRRNIYGEDIFSQL